MTSKLLRRIILIKQYLKNKLLFYYIDNMKYIKIKIICENEKEETECTHFEEKENSAIVVISVYFSELLIQNERKYDKKSTIYFGEKLVKEYVRLPYENVYEDEEGMGCVCLFPKAKYEFMF